MWEYHPWFSGTWTYLESVANQIDSSEGQEVGAIPPWWMLKQMLMHELRAGVQKLRVELEPAQRPHWLEGWLSVSGLEWLNWKGDNWREMELGKLEH